MNRYQVKITSKGRPIANFVAEDYYLSLDSMVEAVYHKIDSSLPVLDSFNISVIKIEEVECPQCRGTGKVEKSTL